MRVWVLHDVARLGGGGDVAETIGDLAARCQGELAPLMARNARALAARDPDELDRLATAFFERGFVLFAAEAAAAASGLHRRAGRRGAAMAAGARARAWEELTEGARTPLLEASEAPDDLTDREAEVARLASAGLSDRDIARRLHLSVRTVQSHLYRTYRKLGVADRTELAALFTR
jgi:DNA-binding NarL/FixJ family response regulator